MNKAEETEHCKLLRKWATGTLSRAGILRCMVLSRKAEHEVTDDFASKFAARSNLCKGTKMTQRTKGPKRNAERWAKAARDEIGVRYPTWVRKPLADAWMAGYRAAARARRLAQADAQQSRGQSMDELHQTREAFRALVLAVEAKDLHKAFGIFDCPMANAHKLLSDEYLYGSTRDVAVKAAGSANDTGGVK